MLLLFLASLSFSRATWEKTRERLSGFERAASWSGELSCSLQLQPSCRVSLQEHVLVLNHGSAFYPEEDANDLCLTPHQSQSI